MKRLILVAVAIISLSAFTIESGYKVGDKAMDFKLKNIDDKMVSLSEIKNAKGFIVVFTCNHCPYAIKYQSRINDLNKKFESKGYPVIAINPNDETAYSEDSFENMKKRHKEQSFTFPYLRDETQEIAKAYGATKTPHIYILQKDKNDLIVKYIGSIDDNADSPSDVKERYAESAINSLLEGKEITQQTTKAIGCSIKWKK